MVEILKASEGRKASIVSEICVDNQNDKTKTDKDPETGSEKRQQTTPADFEEAMSATGFGKFNGFLLLCTMPAFIISTYITTAVSYVLASAECDLKLDLVDMGTINSVPYMGMMASGMIWGYLSDTLGRKKIIVWGFFTLSICELVSSQSQTYWFLFLTKFLSGFMFNGPFVVVISYLSEMHTATMRARILLYTGCFYSIGNISLPLIAWAMIPNDWPIVLIDGQYVLHSWHLFLAFFSIPPLLSSLAFYFLPESPKFLMSRGRNEEALEVFQKIYSINSGKPMEDFPIKCLVDERAEKKDEAPRGWEAIKAGFGQLKPLAQPPYLSRLLLACFIQWAAMLGANTLRLWFPQLATILEAYDAKNTEAASLCTIVEKHIANKTEIQYDIGDSLYTCETLETSPVTYMNSMIIGVCTLVTYLSAGLLVNSIGKRKLTFLTLVSGCVTSLALYWSASYSFTVSLFAIFVSFTSVTGSVLSTIVVDMFSTSIRAMAVAIFMMAGRIGTIIGGVIFPHLLSAGCLYPLLAIASLMLLGGIMCFLLPRTTLKKLE